MDFLPFSSSTEPKIPPISFPRLVVDTFWYLFYLLLVSLHEVVGARTMEARVELATKIDVCWTSGSQQTTQNKHWFQWLKKVKPNKS